MADIDDRGVLERDAVGRREKIAAARPKRIDDGQHTVTTATCHGDQIAEATRSPRRGVNPRSAGQGTKDAADQRSFLAGKTFQHLPGMCIQRAAQPAEPLVLVECDADRRIMRIRLRLHPHAVQDMLHERKLIGAPRQHGRLIGAVLVFPRRKAGKIVQQAVDQSGLEREPAYSGWPLDRLPDFLPCHAWRQVEARVDPLRQPREQRAGTQELRPHRHHDVDRDIRRLRAFQQQRDECLRLLVAGVVSVTKQLLELVDQEQQAASRLEVSVPAPLDHRAGTAGEEARKYFDIQTRQRGFVGRRRELQQGPRQVHHRPVAGPHQGDRPMHPRREQPQIQCL